MKGLCRGVNSSPILTPTASAVRPVPSARPRRSYGNQALLLYDMHTQPFGRLRVAEHFTVSGGLIQRIRHVHDTAVLRSTA